MSYWVYLKDNDDCTLSVESHTEGGTIALGGSPEAEINITYNYGTCYSLLGFSIKDLHGKSAADTVQTLGHLVKKLGTRRYEKDYWADTPGNAGHALSILHKWALQHPTGIWKVS